MHTTVTTFSVGVEKKTFCYRYLENPWLLKNGHCSIFPAFYFFTNFAQQKTITNNYMAVEHTQKITKPSLGNGFLSSKVVQGSFNIDVLLLPAWFAIIGAAPSPFGFFIFIGFLDKTKMVQTIIKNLTTNPMMSFHVIKAVHFTDR